MNGTAHAIVIGYGVNVDRIARRNAVSGSVNFSCDFYTGQTSAGCATGCY